MSQATLKQRSYLIDLYRKLGKPLEEIAKVRDVNIPRINPWALNLIRNLMFFNRFFSAIYGAPDVLGSIQVGVHFQPAMRTFKRFAISGTNLMAPRTSLRSVGRVYKGNRNACSFGLIFNFLSKVREIPLSNSGTKLLTFLVGRISNTFKVFKSNSLLFFQSLRNNSLCNSMVHDRSSSFVPFPKAVSRVFYSPLCL